VLDDASGMERMILFFDEDFVDSLGKRLSAYDASNEECVLVQITWVRGSELVGE
jgi:hypothetical protein